MQNPDRAETISQNAAYLQRFVKGISICKKDERANNGGCTEPHVSHVLAARLSSRPLAWSETTLKHLAPILAAGSLTLNRKSTDNEQPVSLRKAAARASKAFLRKTEGLPSPNAIGTLQKKTGKPHLYKKFSNFRQTRIIRTRPKRRIFGVFSFVIFIRRKPYRILRIKIHTKITLVLGRRFFEERIFCRARHKTQLILTD